MIEVKMSKLPSKVVFFTLLEALLMLNDDTVRIEIGGRYKIELFQLGIYYQDSLATFPFSGTIEFKEVDRMLERMYE